VLKIEEQSSNSSLTSRRLVVSQNKTGKFLTHRASTKTPRPLRDQDMQTLNVKGDEEDEDDENFRKRFWDRIGQIIDRPDIQKLPGLKPGSLERLKAAISRSQNTMKPAFCEERGVKVDAMKMTDT
jgi:hypothetical protein